MRRRLAATVAVALTIATTVSACGDDVPFVDGACESAINLSRAASRAAVAAARDDREALEEAINDAIDHGQAILEQGGAEAQELAAEIFEIGSDSVEAGELTRDEIVAALASIAANASDLCRNGEVVDSTETPAEDATAPA